VTAAIATRAVQDHHVVRGKTSQREIRRANLLDSAFDLKRLPTQIQHFRHEWNAIEGAVFVKGRQYLFWTSYEHAVTSAESAIVHRSLA
jgi:hypothetical protein